MHSLTSGRSQPVVNSVPYINSRAPAANLWFIAFDMTTNTSYLGRMTIDGGVTEFGIPQQAVGITSGRDGNIWFMYWLPATVARFLIP